MNVWALYLFLFLYIALYTVFLIYLLSLYNHFYFLLGFFIFQPFSTHLIYLNVKYFIFFSNYILYFFISPPCALIYYPFSMPPQKFFSNNFYCLSSFFLTLCISSFINQSHFSQIPKLVYYLMFITLFLNSYLCIFFFYSIPISYLPP